MKIIGHRGAKGLAPENTLASFAKALQHHVDEIECDVHITKDNVVIMEHDRGLENEAGDRLTVSEHTYADLLKHKPTLATLIEGIELINRQVKIQIEVKHNQPVEPVLTVVRSFLAKGWKLDDFLLSSRDYKVLSEAHKQMPELPIGVIDAWSSLRAVYHARKLGTKRISMNEHVMWPPFIDAMHRRGYKLCGYTMDDPVRAKRWAEYGLYAVITDYPDMFDKKELH